MKIRSYQKKNSHSISFKVLTNNLFMISATQCDKKVFPFPHRHTLQCYIDFCNQFLIASTGHQQCIHRITKLMIASNVPSIADATVGINSNVLVISATDKLSSSDLN